MNWVFFTAFGTCISSSTDFLVVFIFLAFEAPQGSRDVLFDSLYTIAYLHLLGNVGLVECQDIGVGFFFSSPFLIIILFMFVTSCFPRTADISTVAIVSHLVLWPGCNPERPPRHIHIKISTQRSSQHICNALCARKQPWIKSSTEISKKKKPKKNKPVPWKPTAQLCQQDIVDFKPES